MQDMVEAERAAKSGKKGKAKKGKKGKKAKKGKEGKGKGKKKKDPTVLLFTLSNHLHALHITICAICAASQSCADQCTMLVDTHSQPELPCINCQSSATAHQQATGDSNHHSNNQHTVHMVNGLLTVHYTYGRRIADCHQCSL